MIYAKLIKTVFSLALSFLVFIPLGCKNREQADIILMNGNIIDGSGSPVFLGDVVIRGDSILAVGKSLSSAFTCKQVIDATGFNISPGFIDPILINTTYFIIMLII